MIVQYGQYQKNTGADLITPIDLSEDISPEAFAANCSKIVQTLEGHAAHRALDALVTDLLSRLGYGDGMRIFIDYVRPYHPTGAAEMMTPGPWSFVYFQGDKGGTFLITANNGEDIATCNKPKNARAIAALPELVEALKEMVAAETQALSEFVEEGLTPPSHEASYVVRLKKARYALAKMEETK